MPAKLDWKVHREKFEKEINDRAEIALNVVGTHMVSVLKKVVGIPVVKIKGVVTVRSKPGEPPRLETGFGQSSIQFKVVRDDKGHPKLQISVAKNAWYMAFLEARMNRPWLVVTMQRERANMARILDQVMKK